MENVWAGKAAVMKKEIVLKNKAILHFDREVQMISYILTMAFSALGFDEVSTRTRRRRDKGYLTFWGRWREFANILIGEGITYAETKHCAANTEAYTLTGNNTYGNETLRHTTIQNKYCIQCVSQHTQLWLYSGKAVGLASPQRERFAGIKQRGHFASIRQ